MAKLIDSIEEFITNWERVIGEKVDRNNGTSVEVLKEYWDSIIK